MEEEGKRGEGGGIHVDHKRGPQAESGARDVAGSSDSQGQIEGCPPERMVACER